jgi:3-oxoacyl-[acyl-carrier protein] reductase
MSRALTGKVAVVTGASRGIGLETARRFVAAGARVAVCSRNAQEIAKAGEVLGGALARACDVSDARAVDAFAGVVQSELGTPDVIVNNAGIVARARVDELDEAGWDAVLGVNLKGTFLVSRRFLPAMIRRGSGRIVNVSSISGTLGTPRLSAYCAAKHGVIGFTRALAEEVREQGLQVNAVCPGSVDTQMLVGSGFSPDMSAADVASVILYLACDAPAALTGAAIDVFG